MPFLREAYLRHSSYYANILRNADEIYARRREAIRGLELFDLEWENIRTGQDWARLNSDQDDGAALLYLEYSLAGSGCITLRRHPRERIYWFEGALVVARRLDNRVAEASLLSLLGRAYIGLGEVHKSIEFFERALRIKREIGGHLPLGSLAAAYVDLGKTKTAIIFLEEALAIARESNDRLSEGLYLSDLGSAYNYLGEPRKAIQYFEQALIIRRETGDRLGQAKTQGSLGNSYWSLGKTRKAIEHYEQSLAVIREFGDKHSECSCLGNLAAAYSSLGKFHKAIELYERELVITREIGDRRQEGITLGSLGQTYLHIRNKRKASEYVQNAKEIFNELGLPLPFSVIATLKGLEMPGWLLSVIVIINFFSVPVMRRFGFARRIQRFVENETRN